MFQKKSLTIWTAVALAAVFAACSKAPQAEIDAAAASLGEAETASSGVYATEDLTAAKVAIEALDAEVAAQGEKFALFRSYDKAAELAAAAEQAALAARTAAEDAKLRAQANATAALEGLTGSEQAASALLSELGTCRRKPKGFAADLETLGGTLSGLAAQRAEVETAIADEDFLGAIDLAGSIQGQVDGLIVEMDEAKTKIGC